MPESQKTKTLKAKNAYQLAKQDRRDMNMLQIHSVETSGESVEFFASILLKKRVLTKTKSSWLYIQYF